MRNPSVMGAIVIVVGIGRRYFLTIMWKAKYWAFLVAGFAYEIQPVDGVEIMRTFTAYLLDRLIISSSADWLLNIRFSISCFAIEPIIRWEVYLFSTSLRDKLRLFVFGYDFFAVKVSFIS
jgi:hypothetical protein